MRISCSVFLFLLLGLPAAAQTKLLDPDTFLLAKKRPGVLLVGAFHFAYYNFDAHKTEKDKQVDILSPQKQKEVEELLSYVSKFKPTKVVVEADANTGYLMARYRRWKKGERPLGKDEIEQLGFRLIDRLRLDTIYGCNDGTLSWDLYNTKDSLQLRPLLDSIYSGWDFTTPAVYKKLYAYEDSMLLRTSLLDYFKWRNSDKVQDRSFGYYLMEDFTLGDTRGADALSMHWYNRNLRIYRHIQQITASPDDRILVIYGAGHIDILRHLFECSPEYRLVKFNDVK